MSPSTARSWATGDIRGGWKTWRGTVEGKIFGEVVFFDRGESDTEMGLQGDTQRAPSLDADRLSDRASPCSSGGALP